MPSSSLDRLVDRLHSAGVSSFHVTWGPDAENMTPAERAEVILAMLEDIDARRCSSGAPKSKRKPVNVRDWLKEKERQES